MGMTGCYVALSEEDFYKHKNEGVNIYEFTDEIYENDGIYLDVDKAWDAIAFLFNKFDDKNAEYVMPLNGGTYNDLEELIERFESEYGVFYVNNEQVQRTYKFLQSVSLDDLKAHYDVKEMYNNDIYCVLEDEDSDDFFEYIASDGTFEEIKNLFKTATQREYGVLFAVL